MPGFKWLEGKRMFFSNIRVTHPFGSGILRSASISPFLEGLLSLLSVNGSRQYCDFDVTGLIPCIAAYRLYTVVPRLVKFVDMLTNWYVRTNRRRLKVRSSKLCMYFCVLGLGDRTKSQYTGTQSVQPLKRIVAILSFKCTSNENTCLNQLFEVRRT